MQIKELVKEKNIRLATNLHPLSSKNWVDKVNCKYKNFLFEKNTVSVDLMLNEQRKFLKRKRKIEEDAKKQ